MKKIARCLIFALCLFPGILFLNVPVADSQAVPGKSMLVVDLQRVLREAAAVQTLQREIEERRQHLQAQIRDHEEALRQAEQELIDEQAGLNQEDYASRRAALENKAADFQREIQESKRRLDQLYTSSMNRVQDELTKVIGEIAAARDADIVLAKNFVVLVRPALEITDEALIRLNEALPAVPLEEAEKIETK